MRTARDDRSDSAMRRRLSTIQRREATSFSCVSATILKLVAITNGMFFQLASAST